MYTRQLKQLRLLRRDEYKREVTSVKIQLEAKRTDELVKQKDAMLRERRAMRAQNTKARQTVSDRLEKMKQSSSFDVSK